MFILHTKYVDVKPVPFMHQMLCFLCSSHPPRSPMAQILPLGLPGHLIHKQPGMLLLLLCSPLYCNPCAQPPHRCYYTSSAQTCSCPLSNKFSGSLTFHFASLHLLYSSWSLSSSLSWLDFPLPCSLAQR